MAASLIHLQRWLLDRRQLPFAFGTSDCCLVLADWACANGYSDGAASLRGTYSLRDEMEDLLKSSGGALGLVDGCARRAGLKQSSKRTPGCVAVVGSGHDLLRQWGAIWDGQHWQIHWGIGFEALHAPVLKMWRV